ncbi:hypothetical protein [Romboutsia sp.]|uniref:hypothetical protein n=1 Tax=Romboutsia sp. TaxID=1965302 RepID=UPI003F319954
MKIREKLAVVAVVTFILNTTILFGYYKYSMSDKISSLIQGIETNLDNKANKIYQEMLKNGSTDNIEKILTEDKENNYYLSIKNTNGNQIYQFGRKLEGTVKTTSIKLVDIK